MTRVQALQEAMVHNQVISTQGFVGANKSAYRRLGVHRQECSRQERREEAGERFGGGVIFA